MKGRGVYLSIAFVLAGCASAGRDVPVRQDRPVVEDIPAAKDATATAESDATIAEADPIVTTVGFDSTEQDEEAQATGATPTLDRDILPPVVGDPEPPADGLSLNAVVASVYDSYPLLESALYERNIAAGQQLAANGNFDLKLKAASENGPTGFYQTYRQSVGLVQPVYHGGEVFGGYRIGRGDFQPWYQERQTNDGGEFKAGIAAPLARNRDIDARRAELWRTTYGRQLVEPEIQAQLIDFVQQASYVYWEWVAAGERFRIADRVLELAEARSQRIQRQVEENLLDPPELTDNLRLIAERRVKRADTARKLQQQAVKLSLYHRSLDGRPVVPDPAWLPTFPEPEALPFERVGLDVQIALEQRPETRVLNLMQRQLQVDYAEAENDLRPSIDAVLAGSQDVGYPTSSKNDKGEFELDASVFVDVPIQRRKARGKMQAVQGKLSQLYAKRRLTEDKIVADVQSVYAGLMSAYEQVEQARLAVEYAEELARRERRSFEEGASDLLKVTLREQYAAESAEKAVDALLLYHLARADYRAALAQDRLP